MCDAQVGVLITCLCVCVMTVHRIMHRYKYM